MNVESIAEVKVLVSGYQAEYGRSSGLQITAVTKSGTNQLPRIGLLASSAIPTGNPTAGRIFSTATQDVSCRKRTWATRSAARSGNRAAGTSSSSSTATSMRREPAGTTPSGSGCRRRSNGPATSRRRLDNNGAPYPYIKDPLTSPAHARRRTRSRCFQDGGVLGRIPGGPALRHGPEHPQDVPDAERQPARRRVQLREHQADREPHRQSAGRSHRLPAHERPCGRPSSTSGWSQKNQIINGSLPGFNDTQAVQAGGQHVGRDGQLHVQPDDVPRSDLRAQPERADGLRTRPGRNRADLLPERFRDEPDRQPLQCRAGEYPVSVTRMPM